MLNVVMFMTNGKYMRNFFFHKLMGGFKPPKPHLAMPLQKTRIQYWACTNHWLGHNWNHRLIQGWKIRLWPPSSLAIDFVPP